MNRPTVDPRDKVQVSTVDDALRVNEVVRFLFPAFDLGERPTWPPDAFAVAASILKHSGAYTHIVNRWPPDKVPGTKMLVDEWNDEMVRLREVWREEWLSSKGWPPEVQSRWEVVLEHGNVPVEKIEYPTCGALIEALAGIVAAADQASFGFGILARLTEKPEDARWIGPSLISLSAVNTLCQRVHPSRARVLPKLHNPLSGMTLRSLTHNLALWDRSEVEVDWKQLNLSDVKWGLNVLVLPWPLKVDPSAIHSAAAECEEQMPEGFGFFTYDMSATPLSVDRVRNLFDVAESSIGQIDAIVFPEMSMTRDDFETLNAAFPDTLIVAGVGKSATATQLGYNQVGLGLGNGVKADYQSKHHRWRLESDQIAQYGFGPSLGERRWWWEAIELDARRCTFVSATTWLTYCVLICEDLARQDPVAELVRSVGPNLVIALLMDGPQIPDRWSARYATVLADDPRSSVLTVTCAGLVDLANAQRGGGGKRSIGLWKDAVSGKAREIVLEPGAEGVVLSLCKSMEKEWTADGRHDDGTTGYLRLTGVHQVRPTPGAGGRVPAP